MPFPQIQERIGELAVPLVEEQKEFSKERIKAYEQPAADAKEYIIMLEAELQRICAGILALVYLRNTVRIRTHEFT